MDEVPTTWGTCSKYEYALFIEHGREGGDFLWGRVLQIATVVILTIGAVVAGTIMAENGYVDIDGEPDPLQFWGVMLAVMGGMFIPFLGSCTLGALWGEELPEVAAARSARSNADFRIQSLVRKKVLISIDEANHWDSNFKPVVSNVLTDQQHLQLEKSGWVSTQVSELDQAKIAVREAIVAANAADKAIGLQRVGQMEKLTNYGNQDL